MTRIQEGQDQGIVGSCRPPQDTVMKGRQGEEYRMGPKRRRGRLILTLLSGCLTTGRLSCGLLYGCQLLS